MRSAVTATAYFNNLKTEFTQSVYSNASLRGRGLPATTYLYEYFPIFQNTLSVNENSPVLTDQEKNNSIDYLIEMTLK